MGSFGEVDGAVFGRVTVTVALGVARRRVSMIASEEEYLTFFRWCLKNRFGDGFDSTH